ncbi:uncharacterized protein K444DRAFT_605894, partial [Hyaloscypha bicolor E]
MRFDCCSYPPSCPAVSLLVVLVLHRIEAFGNPLRIPPQPPLPPSRSPPPL